MWRIKARIKALEDQLRRAASSVALNMGEGEYSHDTFMGVELSAHGFFG